MMIFDALADASDHNKIIIRSDDTDVLVLALYYYGKELFPLDTEMFIHSGHRPRERYIPVSVITKKLGNDLSSAKACPSYMQ